MARGGWTGPIDVDAGGGGPQFPPFPPGAVRWVRPVLVGLALLILLFTGYYQVDPNEVGVVQLFGAYVRTTGPGPHFKIPFGVETVTKVPVQRQLKMEFGFRTTRVFWPDVSLRLQFAGDL